MTKKVNRTKIDGEITKIFFFNTDNYTIIDTEDYPVVREYCWHENDNGYARGGVSRSKHLYLHQLIIGAQDERVTDHINRNKLDNRKCNLRKCSSIDNSKNTTISTNNTSGTTGVYYNKSRRKWYTEIRVNGKYIYLGCYAEKQEAVDIRTQAELQYLGEFAPSICANKN